MGNIVERYLNGFCVLGMVIFHRLLTFHLNFQLQMLLEGGFFTETQGSLHQGVVLRSCNFIEVRGDLCVSVCTLGLT